MEGDSDDATSQSLLNTQYDQLVGGGDENSSNSEDYGLTRAKDKIWGRPWCRPWGRPWCGGGQFSKKEKKEISIIFNNIYATDYFRLLGPC